MARNFVQEGDTLTLIAPSGGVTAGVGYVIGSLFVVALTTAAAGAKFDGATEGVFTMTKAAGSSGKAFTEGEAIFWDDGSNKRWDKTGSGLFQVGVAVEAALTTATTVKVAINRRALAAVGA
jgi:predicted RecA/RadA family phage recombinase